MQAHPNLISQKSSPHAKFFQWNGCNLSGTPLALKLSHWGRTFVLRGRVSPLLGDCSKNVTLPVFCEGQLPMSSIQELLGFLCTLETQVLVSFYTSSCDNGLKFLETCFEVLETSFQVKIVTHFPKIQNFPKIVTNCPTIVTLNPPK